MTREEFNRLYMNAKTYIGDSVYVHFDGYHFILETINGYPDDPRNRIVLTPEVINELLDYRKKVYAAGDSMNQNKD